MTRSLISRLALLGLALTVLVGPSTAPSGQPADVASSTAARALPSGTDAGNAYGVGGPGRRGKRGIESASPGPAKANHPHGEDPSGGPPTIKPTRTRTGPRRAGAPLDVAVGRAAGSTARVQRNLGTRQVALTFDDGPDAATPQLLALLRTFGVKATFCVVGVNVQARPGLIKQIAAEGHTLCNHTWSHDLRLGSRAPELIRADLQRTADEIHKAAPNAPIRYFRHPGGNFTDTSTRVANSLGMISIGWDVDPRDWDLGQYGKGAPLTEHIVTVVTSQARPGSIVLSHDGGNDRSSTLAAYQRLLPWLKNRHELVALPT